MKDAAMERPVSNPIVGHAHSSERQVNPTECSLLSSFAREKKEFAVKFSR